MDIQTIRRGDVGAEVATLQARLNRAGASLSIDGHFDAQTDAAVRAYQSDRGLLVDGIAGPRTQAALLGQAHDAKHLTEADINAAAASLGCAAAAIHAILEVEAPHGGFLPDGRVRILFERHIMRRELKAAGIYTDALAARYPDIINPKPGGYRGGAAEYGRLAIAKQIDPICALDSASWGRMQVMGFHARALGYSGVEAFVADMAAGEAAQLQAGVRFIAADEAMHAALVARDWAAFAERYNGPAYAAHGYDLRLAAAFRRFAVDNELGTAIADLAPPVSDAGGGKRGNRRRSRASTPTDPGATDDTAAEAPSSPDAGATA